MKPVDLFHPPPQHRDRARRRAEDESEPEAGGKLDLPAEYLPFGFGCRVEDGFVAVHGQSGGRHHRSLTLLRMGTASADLFSLGANVLPDQGMDVVPLLAVAVAEDEMGIEEPRERR